MKTSGFQNVQFTDFCIVANNANGTSLVQSCGLVKTICGSDSCYHLPVKTQLTEKCVTGGSYDYFSWSKISYIATFIALNTWIVSKYKTWRY